MKIRKANQAEYPQVLEFYYSISDSMCDSPFRPTGIAGMWFSGDKPYSPSVVAVFLPAAGERLCDTGAEMYRNERGYYWSSAPNGVSAFCLYFYNGDARTDMSLGRANGSSLRCVKE